MACKNRILEAYWLGSTIVLLRIRLSASWLGVWGLNYDGGESGSLGADTDSTL